MIIFEKTGKIINDSWPEIRNKKMNWGNTALRLSFAYAEGFIKTEKGTKVIAYELINGSLRIELFDKLSKNTIIKPVEYFNQFNFDLSYNCFGYCFADSKVFITDPTPFIIDDYEEVDYENADLILFKEHKGFGDFGEELFIYSHGVKKLPNGNVSFKPGINGLVEDVDKKLAIHNYNFNHEIYIKKR